jgi:hypothetical protein
MRGVGGGAKHALHGGDLGGVGAHGRLSTISRVPPRPTTRPAFGSQVTRPDRGLCTLALPA